MTRVVPMSPGIVGPPLWIVDVGVRGVSVIVVGHPAPMNAPVGCVVGPVAPPVPVVEGAIPIVVGVVADPAVAMPGRSVEGRCPPMDVGTVKDTPVTGHVVNRMGVEVPMGRSASTVELSISNEVIDPAFFVECVLGGVHGVHVLVEPLVFAPEVAL